MERAWKILGLFSALQGSTCQALPGTLWLYLSVLGAEPTDSDAGTKVFRHPKGEAGPCGEIAFCFKNSLSLYIYIYI